MKKFILLAAIVLTANVVFGQENVTQTNTRTETNDTIYSADKFDLKLNRFKDNWFVTLGGGAQVFFGDHTKQMTFTDRINPAIDISVGKWFSPGLGVRASVNGLNLKGVSGWSWHSNVQDPNVNWNNYQGFIVNAKFDKDKNHWVGDVYPTDRIVGEHKDSYPLYKTNIKYINTHIDALFNVFNMIGGYNPDRFYTLIPYVGVGWAHSLNEGIYRYKHIDNRMGRHSNEVSANIGILNEFKLTKSLFLALDIRGAYVNDRFDQQIGGRYGEGIASATLGLTYKFGKQRGWDRNRSIIRTVTEKDIQYIRENPTVIQQVEKECDPLIMLLANVTFDFDQDVITEKASKILDEAAEILKKMPEYRFLISGFTDVRGDAKYNENLSARRAAAVVKGLEDRGVPSNMLKSRGVGKRATTMPYEESHEVREGDRKVTIELILNMTYWDKLPKTSY